MKRAPIMTGVLGSASAAILAIVEASMGCSAYGSFVTGDDFTCDGINEGVFFLMVISLFVISAIGILCTVLSLKKPRFAAVLMILPVVLGFAHIGFGGLLVIVPVALLIVTAILSFRSQKDRTDNDPAR